MINKNFQFKEKLIKQKPIFLKNICKNINSFIKVNITGEHAAVLIYQNQLSILQKQIEKQKCLNNIEYCKNLINNQEEDFILLKNKNKSILKNQFKLENQFNIDNNDIENIINSLKTEEKHFNYFKKLIKNFYYIEFLNLKPSILISIWSKLLKIYIKQSISICKEIFNNPLNAINITSEAVEAIIIKHYQEQILYLEFCQNILINFQNNNVKIIDKNFFIFLDDLIKNLKIFLQEESEHYEAASNWLDINKMQNNFNQFIAITNDIKNFNDIENLDINNLANLNNKCPFMIRNYFKLLIQKILSNIMHNGCKFAIKASYLI
ncbi:MAG: demethoxyubiquinone hydroxylase family protein [Rickettsiales bacterium]